MFAVSRSKLSSAWYEYLDEWFTFNDLIIFNLNILWITEQLCKVLAPVSLGYIYVEHVQFSIPLHLRYIARHIMTKN